MYVLAILLLAREATGSFAEAGRVAGAFGLANALGAVAQGRLMDRLGQPRVLRSVAVCHALAVTALVLAAERGAPSAVLALCAVAGKSAALAAAAFAAGGAALTYVRRSTLGTRSASTARSS